MMGTDSSRSKSTDSLAQGLITSEKQLFGGGVQVKSEIANSSTCLSVRLNADGKAYAVALADGSANAYLTETDRFIYPINSKKKRDKVHHYSATSIRFRPWGIENLNQNSLLLVTFTHGKAKTFHYPTGECVHTLKEDREIITSDYSPRGDTFATAGDDGKLVVYDDETRVRLVTYEPPFYERKEFRRIYSIAYQPQGTDELITGGWDGIVRYYDIRIPHMIKQFYGPYICGEGLAFDPSGREICSASWRREDCLQLWDYGSGSLIKTIAMMQQQHRQQVEGLDSAAGGFGSRPRTSVISLPPISSTLQGRRRSSSSVKELKAGGPKLPKMLYCCRYYLNGNFLAVSGSSPNSVAVINKHTNEVLAAVTNLSHSVYCLDTHRSKIVFTCGNHVAVLKIDRNTLEKSI